MYYKDMEEELTYENQEEKPVYNLGLTEATEWLKSPVVIIGIIVVVAFLVWWFFFRGSESKGGFKYY